MSKSKIDWLVGGDTINPFTGCNGPHGKRCTFCYAQKMARRLAGMPGGEKYRRVADARHGDPFWPAFHQSVLLDAGYTLGRARKPRRVFIGSMGDMCFEGSMFCPETYSRYEYEMHTEELQRKIAAFCAALPQHTFLILTKRPDLLDVEVEWPSNVHLGVSISRHSDMHRVATLRSKKMIGVGSQGGGRWHPYMVIWASVEPLLDKLINPKYLAGLDWVVIGAETGTRKDVPASIIQAAQRVEGWCQAYGIPCFTKDNMRKADPGHHWLRELPQCIEGVSGKEMEAK
ncbi:MAG: DUF5131 family protein [Planctomycetota bacterium]|nr:DUF5131 family protein [Planctomycetota bacterium]